MLHGEEMPQPVIGPSIGKRAGCGSVASRRRLGGLLLADALKRAHASSAIVGSSMVVVDAISEHAAAFYEAYSFIRLPNSLRLVSPTSSIAKLFP